MRQHTLFSNPNPREKPRFQILHRNSAPQVLVAIRHKKQNAGATDLESTLEVALDLLREQPHAKQRLLVMRTDFLSDTGFAKRKRRVSPVARAMRSAGNWAVGRSG
jgi:hypothetical protein